jgi:hypothetical protein
MRSLLAVLCLVGFAGSAAAYAADAAAEATRAELGREKKRLGADVRNLTEVTRRLETSVAQLSAAARSVADATARADAGPDEIARREEAVSAAEQEARALLERRRLLADRIVERRRTIAALEADLSGRKPADGLTGRWAVIVEPGEQKGVFRMSLEGTLVSGEYTLEGGYSGSLRGTLVNDRLRLERVDSRLGFSAVYYGRLVREGPSIAGTWEATTFGQDAPGSGRWKAVREEEKEESP